ncbi:DUF5994 family protein [Allorhizocola rhizosphaerae]|uniref:DUF5994 family protein n=1 Tax=Allorhizocola rhizosphaerae TaxID=1872709 RepID=UPI0013C2B771|nr:DUF5994 family protein [Allorhizocola rhizosphaerae]
MKHAIANSRITVISPTPPSTPRLRLPPAGLRRTHLDGGWWPRSTDPVAELPGLVLAIDELRGPVTRLILAAEGWDSRPRRLGVADRVLRLGYFHSQPISLLTALCANGDRVDLLVVPPHTDGETADAAMVMAAATGNLVPAQQIAAAVATGTSRPLRGAAEQAWESEGGYTGSRGRPIAVPDNRIGSKMMHIDKAEVIAVLRSRGLFDRADWVDRELPGVIDTHAHGSLLRLLHIDLATMPSAAIHR